MNDVIHYDQLCAFLKNATLFEIYRLSKAIDNELEDPQRIAHAKKQFKEGDTVEHFATERNSCVTAVVLKKDRKFVTVRNCDDQCRWKIPYHMIKLNARDMVFGSQGQGLSKNSVKVGDRVGFNHDGEEIVGRIIRINQKTVTLETNDQFRWRVSYRALYTVIDGKVNDPRVIEYQEE